MSQDLVGMINSRGGIRLREPLPLIMVRPLGKEGWRVHQGETPEYKMRVYTSYSGGKIKFQNVFLTPKEPRGDGKRMAYTYSHNEVRGTLYDFNIDDKSEVTPDEAVNRILIDCTTQ